MKLLFFRGLLPCFALFLLLIAIEKPARAYADPGSGALIWQGLIAALVGASYYSRRIVHWFKTRAERDEGK